MGVIEKAVNWAISIANDQSHGYSQADRWGPDYDCSSFVISAFEQAGVAVREAGASYTGNMYGALLSCGFRDVSAEVEMGSGRGIQAGDVLLNKAQHTCLAIGNFRVANCRTDEGNPQSGDQSGNEIRLQNYWNYPWDCVLRYAGGESAGTVSGGGSGSSAAPRSSLKKGDRGEDVKALQQALIAAGYSCGNCGADGIYGNDTFRAVAAFQEDAGMSVNGVADADTIARIRSHEPAAASAGAAAEKPEIVSESDTATFWPPRGTSDGPAMCKGMRGKDVALLQAFLTCRGCTCAVDGIFGNETEIALSVFQVAKDLPVTGCCDLSTWHALCQY